MCVPELRGAFGVLISILLPCSSGAGGSPERRGVEELGASGAALAQNFRTIGIPCPENTLHGSAMTAWIPP